MRAGVFEYLMKPCALKDARLLINHLLDVRALRQDRSPDETPTRTWCRWKPTSRSRRKRKRWGLNRCRGRGGGPDRESPFAALTWPANRRAGLAVESKYVVHAASS